MTSKSKYSEFKKFHKGFWCEDVVFVHDPDLLHENYKYSVRSGIYFWISNNLFAEADKGAAGSVVGAITRIIMKLRIAVESVEIILRGYLRLSRFLKMSKLLLALLVYLAATMQALAVGSNDSRYVGELHPSVIVSEKDRKVVVVFLKSNFKNSIEGAHVATGEIYYLQVQPLVPALKYVWKVEGDQISSVFFFDWKTPGKSGRSMYVLTKNIVSNQVFEGYSYSVMELPIILDGNELSLNFFPGDLQDSKLQNCYEGLYLEEGKVVSCAYKSAGDIKEYLTLQNK